MTPYYKYKKERLEKKFDVAMETLLLLQGAIKEYSNTNSIYLRRSIIGYFQDLSEYVVDMSEIYLVMTDNYIDGYSGTELLRKARINGFFDDDLLQFLTKIVRLRNRYTHDYYKREVVEEDIFKCCFSEMMYLEIFLEVTDTEVHLKRK